MGEATGRKVTDVFDSSFYTFGVLAVGGAIRMVVARRLVHSALFLVLSFLSAGGLSTCWPGPISWRACNC